MQQIAAFDQIKFRAARIRLPLKELARRAGLGATSTVMRLVNGETSNPRIKTVQAIEEVLAIEEAALRRHLRELERSREGRQMDLVDALGKPGEDTR